MVEAQAPPATDAYLDACLNGLGHAEAERYRGYNKHDALNSPLLTASTLGNRWLRLAMIQAVMRAPLNLRPLLGVKKSTNAKGLSLFTRAYLSLHENRAPAPRGPWLEKAGECLHALEEHALTGSGYSGACWGYPYDWQDAGFFAPRGMANCVVTCFVSRAFLHAYEVTGETRYLDTAASACDFLRRDLTVLHDSEDMLCLSYAPVPMTWVVMDTSALAGVVLAKVARHLDSQELRDDARRLLHYVVDKQTPYGAWYYSHPPSGSHITHDNYHTGFILDAILDYSEASGDDRFMESYRTGLEFYADRLFLANGAPKWMHDKDFPHDIHGAAQGILSFARAGSLHPDYLRLAEKIADWTLLHLYDEASGRFFYQVGRFRSKRFTLMRWCNGWMTWALASLASARRSEDGRAR